MLSHVTLGTNHLERAGIFYDKVLTLLNYIRLHTDDRYIGYSQGIGKDGRPTKPMFWICRPYDDNPATIGNGVHVAFIANSRAQVDAFYELAIAGGATDEGKPGLRPHYHENYYGAFCRDLDGNKIQVVCHKPE